MLRGKSATVFAALAFTLFFIDVAGLWIWPIEEGMAIDIPKYGGFVLRAVAVLFAGGYILLHFRPSNIRNLPTSLWLVLGWLVISGLDNPFWQESLQHVVRFALFMLLFVSLADLPDIDKRLDTWLYRLLLWTIVLSLALALLEPSLAVMHSAGLDGSVRGLFTHKNVFAEFCVMLAAWLMPSKTLSSKQKGILLLLVLIAVVVSKSSASLFIFVFSLGAYYVLTLPKSTASRSQILLLAGIGTIPAYLAGSTIFAVVLQLLDRKATLTGRTYMWEYMYAITDKIPLQGLGYGVVMKYESIVGPLRLGYYETMTSTHNSYLDILLGLGVAGCVIFGIWVVELLYLGCRSYVAGQTAGLRLLVVGGAYLLYGTIESSAGLADRLPTMMAIGAVMLCGLAQRKQVENGDVTAPLAAEGFRR